MRKYIVGLFVFASCTLLTTSGVAQTIFAGGEIHAKYVGNGSETCNDKLPYEITFRFFRDAPVFTIDPLPLTTDIFIVDITSKNPMFWTDTTITLDSLKEIPALDNLCIMENSVITDGGYYSNTTPVMLYANRRYKFIYGVQAPGGFSYIGVEYHSPANSNINAGQTFFVRTEIHTFCDTVRTFSDDTPSEQEVVYNLGKNQGALWSAKTEILETLCEGNSYRFDLNDYVKDVVPTVYTIMDRTEDTVIQGPIRVRDSLSFRLKPILTGENRAAIYINPRNTYDPFPTSASDPFRFNEGTGVMTFTPQLALGERIYIAPITIEVTEWKPVFTLEDDGTNTGNFIRRTRWDTASIMTRQIRLIIANQNLCDDNLPVVESSLWNSQQQAWEFDCASDVLEFRFSKPMLYRSFSLEAPYDFRVFRGTNPRAPIDQSAYNPDGIFVHPDSVNNFGEFSSFKLFFNDGLGPGTYSLFTRVGNDSNTVENRCGFFMPEYQSTTFIINREYEYIFKDDDDKILLNSQKNFCYPGDAPIFNLDALRRQTRNIVNHADSFHFSYNGTSSPFAPPRIIDSAQLNDSRFNVYNTISIPKPYDYPDTPLGNETQGFWTVGVGLNFPWYSFDGITQNDERCYDDDFTTVTFFTHPKVNTVDIDLCRQERWPVIRDLVDPKYTDPTNPNYSPSGNPVSYSWVKYSDSVRTVLATNANGEVIGYPGDTVVYNSINIGGSSNGTSQAAGNVNDTLDLELGVATGIGIGSLQKVKVYVTFPNGCVDSNAIKIVKQDVNVLLSPHIVEVGKRKDTIICLDEAFRVFNTLSEEYLRPDYMSRQWYFGEDVPNMAIPNDTTDTLSASRMSEYGKGWYKLIVTKTTENSTCEGMDSIYVNVADSLEKTDPVCSIVTFDKLTKELRQRFYWPTVDGAERYEVRGVDQQGRPLDSLGTTLLPGGNVEWYRANDTYGIHHWISGKEVRLFVRAVNNEVPEGSSCKYGEGVIAEACEVIVKPTNVFTPNGDGINDVLRFDLLELFDGNKLQVYNRWGRLVYESNDYQNDWNGGDFKDGTYFYILDISDPSGVQDIFKGTVTILR